MVDKKRIPESIVKKYSFLKEYIKGLGSLAVGFSGGVDSTFLLAAAHEVLGDKAVAVTAAGDFVPERELNEAKEFCKKNGITQFIIKADPFKYEEFRMNRPDRCYVCKKHIFTNIIRTASEKGIESVAEGSNMDDLGDYRPGSAAVRELGIKSPLREAGLYKSEIRTLSDILGLPTWNKPAYACLASRFVYGEEITAEKLLMVERAEQFLIDKGFPEERVRIHGNLARIEVPPKDISLLASEEIRSEIYDRFRELGFMFVSLDLKGYRTGSMNITIDKRSDQK